MSLVTSFFNKTQFKCNLKRIWWIPVLSSIFTFLVCTVPLYDAARYNGSISFYSSSYISEFFEMIIYNGAMVLGICCGFILSLLFFGYLNKVNACSCIHGLPVTRKQLYFTNLITSVLLMVIPFVLNGLLWISPLLDSNVNLVYILKALYIYLVYGLFVLSLVTLIGMFTGNSSAQGMFSAIVMLLPAFLSYFIYVSCRACLHGYNDNSMLVFENLLENIYLSPVNILSWKSLIYIGMTMLFVALGWFTYRLRSLESCGELMAFDKLKNIFKILVSVCSGILGYLYMVEIWNVKTLMFMIPFSVIGLLIAHMLVNKSFSLKGILKSFIVSLFSVLMLVAIFEFDLTGFQHRVPDFNDVSYVRLDNIQVSDTFYADNGVRYSVKDVYVPKFEKTEEIQAFVDMHKYAIKNGKNEQDEYFINKVQFSYKLKNGRNMHRAYYLTDEEVEKYLLKIYNSEAYLKYMYPVLDDTEKIYDYATIEDSRDITHSQVKYSADSSEFKEIVEAIKLDKANNINEGKIRKQTDMSVTRITLKYYKQGLHNNKPVDEFMSVEDIYNIKSSDVNTLRVLNELGFFDNKNIRTSANGLKSVTAAVRAIYLNGQLYGKGGFSKEAVEYHKTALNNVTKPDVMVGYEDSVEKVVYDDKERMKQLYECAFTEYDIDDEYVNIEAEFIYEDGTFGYYFSVPFKDVPSFIIDDFAVNE